MTYHRVLFIGDAEEVGSFLISSLAEDNIEIHQASNGSQGISQAVGISPSVIVTETDLPDLPAAELIGSIREWSSVPIIAISEPDDADRAIPLLNAGADDHLLKPIPPQEFRARVRVALRHRTSQAQDYRPTLDLGCLTVDLAHRTATMNGEAFALAPSEYLILAELAKHEGRIVTHQSLQMKLWGRATAQNQQNLRVYVSYLRRKLLRKSVGSKLVLETEQGIGYRLSRSQEDG